MAKQKVFDEAGLSLSGWVRKQLLVKPDITLEQLQIAYDKTSFPKKDRPTTDQVLHQARSQLRKRWEVAEMDELPHKANGDINVRGFLFKYFGMFNNPTFEHAQKYLAFDGIEVSEANYRGAYHTYLKAHVGASPDANQDAGPRAGSPGRRKYKRRGKGKRGHREPVEVSTIDQYKKIEGQIDGLMAQAQALHDGKLSTALLQARRQAGAFICSHQE